MNDQTDPVKLAGALVEDGFYWSEAIMLAVGKHYLGELSEREIQMTSGFGGGIGGSYLNNCGAFSAGIMIIGGLCGSSQDKEKDEICQRLAARYQEVFKTSFKTLNCGELREEDYGSGGAEPCSVLVERAAQVLMDLIEQYKSEIEE